MSNSTTTEAIDLRPVFWDDGKVVLLDQTQLPQQEVWLELTDYRGVVGAIREMRVRGAPAIGIAGAYAMALAAQELARAPSVDFLGRLERASQTVRASRPTGANLAWAVRRVMAVARRAGSPQSAAHDLVAEAVRIQQEDHDANRRIGLLGSGLISQGSSVLTHCNTGALATGGYGTALGVIKTAWASGLLVRVFATETRPLLQGARLTAWELLREGIDVTILTDSAAGQLMRGGSVHAVIVGADRIAANGDVANKIGTYSLAVLAAENGLPFYVAAPSSTVDFGLPSGDCIPIEERSASEVTCFGGSRIAPDGVAAMNPAFDITPHKYITAIVTEAGVVRPPFERNLPLALEVAVG